jgi:membrane-associated phospholipid phosphatase
MTEVGQLSPFRNFGFREGEFLNLNRFAVVIRIWSVSLVACAAIVAFLFLRMDVPTALHFWNADRPLSSLNAAFGATVILSVESAVILFMVLARLVRGHLSVFGETLVIACLASMCAYVINDHVLKVFFGVPNPTDVVHGAKHGFNLWMGSANSSFPSGHMVLVGAFAGVFMRLYTASIWPLSALLLIAAGLLLVGDWHFLSDIIAGAFLGTSAGILAGEGWAAHSAR